MVIVSVWLLLLSMLGITNTFSDCEFVQNYLNSTCKKEIVHAQQILIFVNLKLDAFLLAIITDVIRSERTSSNHSTSGAGILYHVCVTVGVDQKIELSIVIALLLHPMQNTYRGQDHGVTPSVASFTSH